MVGQSLWKFIGFIILCVHAQSLVATPSEEAEIRKTAENYSSAFATHQADSVVSFWAPDAVYTNPTTGIAVEGTDALTDEFSRWFEQAKADRLTITLSKITFPKPGQAVEKGIARVTFQADRPPVEHAFLALLVLKDGKWLFQKVRQIHLETEDRQRLAELEWLVGDWSDRDEDGMVNIHTDWAMNRNFLIQEFNVWFYDQEVLSGRQVIGWDPRNQNLRSWIFASDGSFGKGTWYRKGDIWFVKIAYLFQDGKTGSAVHSYTRHNDNTYTWFAESREVGGAILPNIGPNKIIRKTAK